MPGRNLNDLKLLGERWRASAARHTRKRFETLAQALLRRLALVRAILLATAIVQQENDTHLARALRRLARRVRRNDSLASPVRMRRLRNIIAGHLWRFLVRNKLRENARFVTIIVRDWQYTDATLVNADPERLLNAFRAQLNRLGAIGTAGFLFVSIDISYNTLHGVFQLHLHGFASGGMLDVVERLRDVPRFKSERCGDLKPGDTKSREGVRVVDPVQINPERLTHLPRPILYAIKQRFFAYTRVSDADEGQAQGYCTNIIPEPANSIGLLWRDRWDLNQTTLMMGMRVGRDGFELLG